MDVFIAYHIIVQLALGLVIVFIVTTVTVVFGCWCGRKRRKQSQFDLPKKGIPDDIDFHNDKQQSSPKISVFGERKVHLRTTATNLT